jgi:hypothetical protein
VRELTWQALSRRHVGYEQPRALRTGRLHETGTGERHTCVCLGNCYVHWRRRPEVLRRGARCWPQYGERALKTAASQPQTSLAGRLPVLIPRAVQQPASHPPAYCGLRHYDPAWGETSPGQRKRDLSGQARDFLLHGRASPVRSVAVFNSTLHEQA